MNIIILAAGPPKKDRQRHLEKFDNEILIDKLIKSCTFENINLYIVIHKENIKLIDNVKKFNNVGILNVDDEYIYTTITKALSVTGDCILVVGDVIDVEKKDIKKFINTEHNCSLCRYKCKWGPDIKKNGFLRRSDIGDCIVKISEKYKKEYLSKELWDKAKYYLQKFYPNMKNIDMKSWNWIMTNVNYAFFFNIWGNKDVNSYKDFGTIYFEKKIYSDND
jgi:hypothetical protein